MSQRLAPLLRFAVVIACLWPAAVAAQIDTGTIVGRVQDPTGAVLPGVTVTATRRTHGRRRDDGDQRQRRVRVPRPAHRHLHGVGGAAGLQEVELRGGPRSTCRTACASTSSSASASITEAVTVTGRAALLQTQSADIGNVVDERQMQDLPLLGRRYSELAFLTPGVVAAPAGITSRGEDTLLQRQRQLRHLEQLHARRRRQQLVLDQPAGTQPAGGAAAGRRAAGVQGADAHLLGRVRQGRRRGHQRLGEAGHQRASAARRSSSSATRRSTPTPGTTTARGGPRASSTSTSPASRSAGR